MAWRAFSLAACLAFAGMAGWWLAGDAGAIAGLVAGSAAWLALDLVRAARVLSWLRAGAPLEAPQAGGLWGEALDRMRRALRTRNEEASAASRRLQDFLAAIQASPNGVVLLDATGRIEWSNDTARQQLGIDPRRDHMQLIGNLVRDPTFMAYWSGNDFAHDAVIESPASTALRPARIAVQLHGYGEGRKLLLSRDVTSIEQAEAMRRDFVANVSHEIRTPLTVLAGFVETLQSLPLEAEERARYLGLMSQQAARMQALVSDLLTLSRLEGSPLPGAGEWTPLALLTAQCEQEAQALADLLHKKLAIHIGAAPALEIAGAASELLSAATNLVSNAVRYTPAGGAIEAGWSVLDDGRVAFIVRDTGPGIAPQHLPRITERFYRVDRSRSRETGGTGLGLAIVKHVAQRHGGELEIQSTEGVGSRFSIAFPADRFRPAAPAESGTSAPPATPSPATSH